MGWKVLNTETSPAAEHVSRKLPALYSLLCPYCQCQLPPGCDRLRPEDDSGDRYKLVNLNDGNLRPGGTVRNVGRGAKSPRQLLSS
jgi:hypothetical protein